MDVEEWTSWLWLLGRRGLSGQLGWVAGDETRRELQGLVRRIYLQAKQEGV